MLVDFIHDFVFPGLLTVLSAAVSYMIWLLQQQRADQKKAEEERKVDAKKAEEELAAIKKGLMLKLRRDIFEDHRRYCVNHEDMEPEDYANICDVFNAYHALGGNGSAEKAFREISEVHLS